jgi:hypothetical protein
MGVHPAAFLEGWVFGDFQSPRLSPDEPSIQPIEASQLAELERAREVLEKFTACFVNERERSWK